MKIIRAAERRRETYYCLSFAWAGDPNAGFSFPCDRDGNVDVEKLKPPGKANYEMCLRGRDESGRRILPGKVECYPRAWTEPAVGKCGCGREVILAEFTNTCECGRDYNWAGQRLAPRECWGEETGEHPSEIP